MNISVDGLTRGATTAVLLAASCVSCTEDIEQPRSAIRLDPVATIIDAFATHQVVALGDWHGNVQLQEVRLALLRDPRFPAAVKDIVVEFGGPQHQAIVDRYVNGDDVADAELRLVWGGSDGLGAEEILRVVRETNLGLLGSQRIRVVLGNTGAESTMEEEAALIRAAVIDHGRKALIIFGSGHFRRKQLWYPISDREWMQYWNSHPSSISTVAHLESAGVSVFSVYAQPSDDFIGVQPDAAAWHTPALAMLEGTVLGLEPFATFDDKETSLTVPDADGDGFHQEQVPADPARSGLTQEQFDAVILLGAREDMKFLEPDGTAQHN